MEVRVLGPVALSSGTDQTEVGGPRQQRLLAALAMNANRVVSSDTLVEIVFEEAPPDGARTTLRSYIARLRKSFEGANAPDAIVTESPGYMLRLESEQSDVFRFSAAIDVARQQMDDEDAVDAASSLHGALEMWRGPAYGVFGQEDWVRAEAVRLEELRTEAWERLIDAQMACGLAAEVIPELTRLIGEHPYRDRLRYQMMLARHRSGRQAEALRGFERYRDELIEVGLEPGHELAALQRSVASHDPTLRLDTPAGTALRGYRLGAAIGDGPHSTVYRAIRPGIGREVALKALRGPIIDDPDFIRNFDRHAKFVSQLEHPHVVPLYDFWREPSGAYVVMRLLPGNLHSHLDGGPLPPSQVITLVEQLSSALAAAHHIGLVHGDIRPSNVLVDGQGNVYVSDVGMARLVQGPNTLPTSPSGYASPEQLAGEPATTRSDQFSLAVLIAHALTGLLPFGLRGMTSPDDEMPSLHAQRSAVPEGLSPVLARATSWCPEDRFESTYEFGTAVVAALGGDQSPSLAVEQTNPYRGLDAFTESETAHFFGREEIIEDLVRLTAADSDGMFVTLVGASGSGKSSIVRAGLIPRLRAGAVAGSTGWFVATMVPGTNPLAELEAALRPVARSGAGTSNGLANPQSNAVAQLIGAAIPADQTLLLIVDQLEELFTLSPEDERDQFISDLTELLRFGRHDVRVVATLRADFYDRPLRYAEFGRMITKDAVTIVGMSASQLDRAIRLPAEGVGVQVESAAVAEIVADVVDEPAALPLLQFTLTELFQRRERDTITLESYRATGGVEAAVAQRADSLVAQLSTQDQLLVRRIFLRLIAVDQNGIATRRRATRSELATIEGEPGEISRILDNFGDARLLGFDRDPTTREPTVELAHEALTTNWPLLTQWVAEAGEGLRIRNQLTAAADAWERDGRDVGALYRGSRLEAATTWLDAEDESLTPLERGFLDAGVSLHVQQRAAEQDQLERERRTNRRLRGLALGVGVGLVFALVAGFVALGQRNDARNQAARADAQTRRTAIGELAVASRETLAIDPELSLLLAIEAVEAGGDEGVAGSLESLHRALLSNRLVATGVSAGRSAAFSPDGERFVAVASDESAAQIWSTEPTVPLTTLTGHELPVFGVSYNHAGSMIASASADGTVRLWDAADGAPLGALISDPEAEPQPTFGSPTFSRDDRLLAATGDDGTIFIWDIESGEIVHVLPRPDDEVLWTWALDFSPDSSRLAVAVNRVGSGSDVTGFIAVWDVESGQLVQRVGDNEPVYSDVRYSPDGSTLYTSNWEGPVKAWEVATGEETQTYSGDVDGVFDIDISDDGRQIGTAGSFGARIWDVRTGEVVTTLVPGGDDVTSIDLSPDGASALTTSQDKSELQLWALDGLRSEIGDWPAPDPASTSKAPTGAVAFDPSSGELFRSSSRGVALTSVSGAVLAEFDRADAELTNIAVSIDGSLVGVAANDGVRLYDAATGAIVDEPLERSPATGVVFDPERGRAIWTGSGALLFDIDGDGRRGLVTSGLWTYDAAFSGDGETIVLTHTSIPSAPGVVLNDSDRSPSTLRVVDAETLDEIFSVDTEEVGQHVGPVRAVASSSDGNIVATVGADGLGVLWDASTGEPLVQLRGHTAFVNDVAFDPLRAEVATASTDGTVKIWDVATGANVLTLPFPSSVSDLSYSSDGRYLAAIGPTGETMIFILETEELLAAAQGRVTRDLTPAECAQYLPNLDCQDHQDG